MKVFYIAAECKPFSKVGGVGDVAGELPPALKEQGIDVEIVTPLYGTVNSGFYEKKPEKEFQIPFRNEYGINCIESVSIHRGELKGVPVHFVGNTTYFEGKYSRPYIYSAGIPFFDDVLRFSFFSEACLRLIQENKPDIVHINDWVLGYLFGRMAMEKIPSKRVLTVHNIGYQGNIGQDNVQNWQISKILADPAVGHLFVDLHEEWNSVNALRLAMELSHKINTVSPNYCLEITKPEDPAGYFEGGKGLQDVAKKFHQEGKLVGILNGFEYASDPTEETFARALKTKADMRSVLTRDFADPGAFLLGFVGRAVEQKFKLLAETLEGKSILEQILDSTDTNLAIVASGIPEYEAFLGNFSDRNDCSVSILFNKEKAGQVSTGCDVFLMPSLFEPCGITQMESLSHATPPLVRWTGGLADTVRPHTDERGTGFGFNGAKREEILRNLIRTAMEARDLWMNRKDRFQELQRNGFNTRFLWSDTAKEYIDKLYLPVLAV